MRNGRIEDRDIVVVTSYVWGADTITFIKIDGDPRFLYAVHLNGSPVDRLHYDFKPNRESATFFFGEHVPGFAKQGMKLRPDGSVDEVASGIEKVQVRRSYVFGTHTLFFVRQDGVPGYPNRVILDGKPVDWMAKRLRPGGATAAYYMNKHLLGIETSDFIDYA